MSAVEASTDLTKKPTLPIQKRIPRRHDQGTKNHHHATTDEYFS